MNLHHMNRRELLRAGALGAGAFSLAPGLLSVDVWLSYPQADSRNQHDQNSACDGEDPVPGRRLLRRFSFGQGCNRGNQAITHLGNGLNKFGLMGVIIKIMAQLGNGAGNHVLGYISALPYYRQERIPGYRLVGVFRQ